MKNTVPKTMLIQQFFVYNLFGYYIFLYLNVCTDVEISLNSICGEEPYGSMILQLIGFFRLKETNQFQVR